MRIGALGLFALLAACTAPPGERGVVRVTPADDLQATVDRAAEESPKPRVVFAPGLYRPRRVGQALLALGAKHDGLWLEGEPGATLTAQNPDVADPASPFFPAAVSHVLYLGDGLTDRTVVRGLRLTGARGLLTHEGAAGAEPNAALRRRIVFYADGGGVKVFGNSSPVLEDLVIDDNRAFYCGGGLSVEQLGSGAPAVTVRHCRFSGNSASLTGAAIDVLPGSAVVVQDSRFERNEASAPLLPLPALEKLHANFAGHENVPEEWGELVRMERFASSAAISVFAGSSLVLVGSELKDNGAGVEWIGYVSWYWPGWPAAFRQSQLDIRDSRFRRNRAYSLKLDPEPRRLILKGNSSDKGDFPYHAWMENGWL